MNKGGDIINPFDFNLISAIKNALYKEGGKKELSDDVDYYIDYNLELMAKPHKFTLLHEHIIIVMSWCNDYAFENMNEDEIYSYIESLFMDISVKIPQEHFSDNEEKMEYYMDFLSKHERFFAHSAFNILFNDRVFLRDFNLKISQYVKTLKISDHPDLLKKDGVIKRYNNLQGTKWLLNALCHRDKEKCQICGADLSRTRTPSTGKIHIDHIVPLDLGGTNDPTNMQILCDSCNCEKSAKNSVTTSFYTNYWEI